MKARWMLLLLLPLLGFAGAVLAWPERGADEESEVEVKLTDTPKAVQDAIAAAAAGQTVDEIEKITSAGLSVYEVEFQKGGRVRSLVLAESGDVIETEETVEMSSLPASSAT